MERFREVSATCSSCGEVNLREDRRIFRTKRARPVLVERILKSITVVALVSVTWILLSTHRGHGGGVVIGFPILMAVLLWDTIGLVTRRRSVFKMEILWPAVVACIGLGPALMVLALDVGINAELDFAVIGPLAVWALFWSLLGFFIWSQVNGGKGQKTALVQDVADGSGAS